MKWPHWIRCDWSRWREGTVTMNNAFMKNPHEKAIQHRRCRTCGKIKIRDLN